MQNSRSLFVSWKPAEIMLAVLFLLAPLYYHPNPGGEGLRIPHNSVIWLMALVFIVFSFYKILKQPQFKLPRYFIFVAAFPILVTVSGFVTGVEQHLKWLFRLLFIWGGLAFFFALFQHQFTPGRRDKLLYVIAVSGLIHAAIGIAQVWFKADLPFLRAPNGVPAGLFQQINNHATFLVSIIVICLYLTARPILFRKSLLRTLPIVLTVLLSAYVVGVSSSRIGALSLLIAVPLMLFALRKPLLRNMRLTVAVLLAMVIGFSAGLLPGQSRLVDKTAAIQSGYSGSARLSIYSISLDLMAENPVFGHGVGSFSRVFQHARPAFYEKNPDAVISKNLISHPHNEMFFWLVEGGLIALCGIGLVLIGTVLALRQCGRSRGLAYLALLLPITLHLQVELPFYISALHWFLWLFLLSQPFFLKLANRSNTLTVYATKLLSVSLLLFSLLFSFLLLHTIRANWDFVSYLEVGQDPEKHRLSHALVNPYLGESAEELDMLVLFNSALQLQDQNFLLQYIDWCEGRIKDEPKPYLLTNLILAQLATGDIETACSNYATVFAMYPRSPFLKNLPPVCK